MLMYPLGSVLRSFPFLLIQFSSPRTLNTIHMSLTLKSYVQSQLLQETWGHNQLLVWPFHIYTWMAWRQIKFKMVKEHSVHSPFPPLLCYHSGASCYHLAHWLLFNVLSPSSHFAYLRPAAPLQQTGSLLNMQTLHWFLNSFTIKCQPFTRLTRHDVVQTQSYLI